MIAGHHSAMGDSLKYIPVYGVRSDGVAYCALPGNVDASTGRYEVLCDFTVSNFDQDRHVFGSHYGNGNGYYFLWHLNKRNTTGLYCFGVIPVGDQSAAALTDSDNVIVMGNNSLGTVSTVNNMPISLYTGIASKYNNGRFLIFRANAGNSATTISPDKTSSVDLVVIRSLKVWFGDTQVADLVPCREKGTNEVCFFNLIDGEFVKNVAGSGHLIEVRSAPLANSQGGGVG